MTSVLPNGDLAALEHGLMMPFMLVPMLLRLELYTGRSGHALDGLPARPFA